LEDLPIGEKKRQVSKAIPIRRMGQPEEVTGCAVFLASEDSDYVVAQTYGVDGGNWMA
jgi:NAD(P)-dependent dehydrogenase (short-subunit alcohol dehydrogenase family)